MLNIKNVKKVPTTQLAFMCTKCIEIRNLKRDLRIAKLSQNSSKVDEVSLEHVNLSKHQRGAFKAMRHLKSEESPNGIDQETLIV
eukprot:gene2097-1966_t